MSGKHFGEDQKDSIILERKVYGGSICFQNLLSSE